MRQSLHNLNQRILAIPGFVHEISIPRWLEFRVIVVCLMLLQGAFMVPDIPYIAGRHPLFYTRILVAGITLLLIYRNPVNFMATAQRDRLLILLHAIIIASVLWSLDWRETFGASIGLATATLLGVYIAANYTLVEQARMGIWALSAIAVLSFLAVLLVPNLAIMHVAEHVGRWTGIMGHKNLLGFNMTLLAIILLYVPAHITGLPRRLQMGLFLFAAFILYFADAAAALVILALGVALAPFYKLWIAFPQYRRAVVVSLAALLALAAVLILLNASFVTGLLGRKTTLTGRTSLWASAAQAIALRPALGFGYEAAFVPTAPIQELKTWKEAIHAHNVFLEVALGTGLVGLVIFMAQYLRAAWIVARRFLADPSYTWSFALVVVSFYILGTLTALPAVSNRGLDWVMYVAVVLTILAGRNPAQDVNG